MSIYTMKVISFNSFSQEDIKKLMKESIEHNNEYLFNELNKLRERVLNLEELIRIYEGRIKIHNGKK